MNRKVTSLLCAATLLLFILGCSENIPDNYGIYAYTNEGRISLSGQKVVFVGNLLQSITGLKGASGPGINSVKYIIVYEKDVNPKWVRLTKLQFTKGGHVQNIFGNTYVDVNLWTTESNINYDVSPVNDKKDMYKITPKEKLAEGFYAVHFGGLGKIGTIEASAGNTAYDFVIGNRDNYQSYEVLQKRNYEEVNNEAHKLIKTMNGYFNNKDYINMKNIYRPNGRIPSDSEWQEFTKGLVEWYAVSGAISDSVILTSSISEEGGAFQVQTNYQKKGQQHERFSIKRIDGIYYITSIE